MHKRIFTLLTILSLSTALLIGCGSTQETSTQSENAATETAQVSDETAEETIDETTDETTEDTAEEPESELSGEPVDETSGETTDAPSEEPVAESSEETVTEPSEEPVAEPSEEPVAEPQVVYTYTDMNVIMYATQTVNVRDLPCTDGENIGSLSANQEITVLGQCNETGWYMFDYNGQTAFASDSYLSTEMVEVQQAPPTQQTSQVSNVPNAADYPEGVWHDMGEYFFLVVSPAADGRVYTNESDINNVKAILEERYPGNWWGPGGFYLSDGRSVFVVSKYNSASCSAFWNANSAG